jgi:hypothetical protein
MTAEPNRLAGKPAKPTSRRGFLGSIVNLAAGAAAMLAGALAASSAEARNSQKTHLCCRYVTAQLIERVKCVGGNKCPKPGRDEILNGYYRVSDCSECRAAF